VVVTTRALTVMQGASPHGDYNDTFDSTPSNTKECAVKEAMGMIIFTAPGGGSGGGDMLVVDGGMTTTSMCMRWRMTM
jgi:hypothetical protein